METEGILFTYNSHGCIAYKSKIKSSNFLIFIDGMGGNILSSQYFTNIKDYCDSNSIVLVYPQLRSHPNYKLFTIQNDIEDISSLVSKIDGNIVILGHSTGCQDSLLYIEASKNPKVKGIILQAPVSDIEANHDLNLKETITRAKKSGLFFEYNGDIWLSERFITVYDERNKEDLFSSYLTDSEFSKWKNYCPILSVLSLQDEFCEKNLSKKFEKMGTVAVLEEGDHSLTSNQVRIKFIEKVDEFLKKISFI